MRYWRAFGASSLIVLSGAALSAAACSASNNPGGGFGGDGGSSTDHGGPGGSVIDGSGGSIASNFPAGGTGGDGSGGSKGCATSKNIAKQKPLDMFIMLDQSASMNMESKWTSVTSAIANFVAQPEAAGLGVGLGYFPVDSGVQCPVTCSANQPCGTGCGQCLSGFCFNAAGGDSCTIGDYANPVVEIGTLPGANNAQVTAITSSIMGHSPDGDGTPTRVGLAGAIQHAQDWAAQNPDHIVIAVLATDGDPNECNSTVDNVAAVAAAGRNATPPAKPVVTYVIGVGDLQANLNQIAQAGGNHDAFIVTPGGNAGQEFLDDLNAIRGASLSCRYPIPMPNGQKPDFKKLNVEYHPGGGGAEETIPNVEDLAHCPTTGDAWYYDDNTNPTEIEMCPATCTKLGADTTGEVDIVLGCDTIQVPK